MLSVVGTGPGTLDLLTERARARHPHRLHYLVHRSQLISHLEKKELRDAWFLPIPTLRFLICSCSGTIRLKQGYGI